MKFNSNKYVRVLHKLSTNQVRMLTASLKGKYDPSLISAIHGQGCPGHAHQTFVHSQGKEESDQQMVVFVILKCFGVQHTTPFACLKRFDAVCECVCDMKKLSQAGGKVPSHRRACHLPEMTSFFGPGTVCVQ
eukprot:scaffold54866_cov18-Tisochrysis_lutea.AAC.1